MVRDNWLVILIIGECEEILALLIVQIEAFKISVDFGKGALDCGQ